jgi:hypothetical protein
LLLALYDNTAVAVATNVLALAASGMLQHISLYNKDLLSLAPCVMQQHASGSSQTVLAPCMTQQHTTSRSQICTCLAPCMMQHHITKTVLGLPPCLVQQQIISLHYAIAKWIVLICC